MNTQVLNPGLPIHDILSPKESWKNQRDLFLEERQRRESLKRKIIVRTCMIILIWKITLSMLLINSLSLSIIWWFQKEFPIHPVILLSILSVLWFSGWIFVLYSLVKWKSNYCTITPDRIISNDGVFSQEQEVCAIKNIETINLHQSFLGKIFRYGTIELYAPTLNHHIWIQNIHNPQIKLKIIEDLIPKTKRMNQHQQDMMILPHGG